MAEARAAARNMVRIPAGSIRLNSLEGVRHLTSSSRRALASA
jgi:hypothetical protein